MHGTGNLYLVRLIQFEKKIELKTHHEFIVISGGFGTCNDIVGYQVSAEK